MQTYIDQHDDKDDDVYCTRFSLFINKASSCYFDSTLVSLLLSNSSFISRRILTPTFPAHSYAHAIQTLLSRLLSEITNQDDHTTCSNTRTILRKVLQSYTIKHKLDELEHVNFEEGPLEPKDVMIVLHNVYNLHQSLQVVTYKQGNGEPIRKTDVTVQKEFIINIGFGEKDDINVDLDKLLIYESIYNTSTKEKLVRKKNYSKFVFLHAHINRLNYDGLNITTSLVFNETFQHLTLSSIIVFRGNGNDGHYVCYFKCNGNWYLYDDLNYDNIKKIGSFDKLLKIKEVSTLSTDLFYITKSVDKHEDKDEDKEHENDRQEKLDNEKKEKDEQEKRLCDLCFTNDLMVTDCLECCNCKNYLCTECAIQLNKPICPFCNKTIKGPIITDVVLAAIVKHVADEDKERLDDAQIVARDMQQYPFININNLYNIKPSSKEYREMIDHEVAKHIHKQTRKNTYAFR